MMKKNHDLLSGWQEIADFLDKSIRTVQRWKRCQGLPVNQPAGFGSTPHASKRAVESWALCGNFPDQEPEPQQLAGWTPC